eukprot:772163-Pyramimonas_sp.AAC.1
MDLIGRCRPATELSIADTDSAASKCMLERLAKHAFKLTSEPFIENEDPCGTDFPESTMSVR